MLEVRVKAHSNQRNAFNQGCLIRHVTHRNVCGQFYFRQSVDRWISRHFHYWTHLLLCPDLLWGNLRVSAKNIRNERVKKLQCKIFINIKTWCRWFFRNQRYYWWKEINYLVGTEWLQRNSYEFVIKLRGSGNTYELCQIILTHKKGLWNSRGSQ